MSIIHKHSESSMKGRTSEHGKKSESPSIRPSTTYTSKRSSKSITERNTSLRKASFKDENTKIEKIKKCSVNLEKEENEACQHPLKKVFDSIKDDYDSLPIKKLFDFMLNKGICPNEDPRFKGVRDELQKVYKGRHLTDIVINFKCFQTICEPITSLLVKIFEDKMVLQEIPDMVRCLSLYYDSIKEITGTDFSVTVTSADGQKLRWGDKNRVFPLNEQLHVITYIMGVEYLGFNHQHEKIGLESKPQSEWVPENPLIGAGALAIIANLHSQGLNNQSNTDKHESLKKTISDFAGRAEIKFDSKSFVSSDRKREYLKSLLCWMISTGKVELPCKDVDRVIQFYLECSSMQVNTDALSTIGATLANGGTCPLTGVRLICDECVGKIVSVLTFSSRQPGIPVIASSSGAVLIVVPGLLGLAIHSDEPMVNNYFTSAVFRHFAMNPYERQFLQMGRSKKTTSCLDSTLFTTARTGDILTLSSLLYFGTSFKKCDYLERTILHVAAAHGHLYYINFVMNYCPMLISARDKLGRSPLDEAQFFNHLDIAERLADWEAVSQSKSSSSTQSSSSKSSDDKNKARKSK